jgi:uncharacterized RDD family membrane protein YckC
MQARWVGLLMILVGPVSLFLAVLLGEAGNREIAAVFVALGLFGGLWSALVGYRVLRGGTSLREVPGLLGAFAVVVVGAFIFGNCPAQSR